VDFTTVDFQFVCWSDLAAVEAEYHSMFIFPVNNKVEIKKKWDMIPEDTENKLV
jgi:hypothetical protein